MIPLVRAAPVELHPPLVVLCDISGSMNPYSRMFLHFLHAITNDRDRVSVFVFGTRLTNITRQLRHRDVDVAMARVADAIKDWSGGTRIGASLREFNWRWARRVLGAERLRAARLRRPRPRGGRRPGARRWSACQVLPPA